MTSISSYGAHVPAGVDTADWVHARFERAVDIVQSLPRSGPIQTNYDDKLLLYSVYKQATEGDIKVPRPGLLDVLGRAKWDAWNKKKGLSPEEAERLYVQGLLKILKGYSDRPQASELIRELETFSLDPRGMVMSGSIAPSSGSSSTSTEGDDHHRRRGAPVPHASSSRGNRHPPPSAARSRPPPPSSHRSRGPPPPASTTSASVAPSLPGYGPPRTRADSPRRPGDVSDDDDYTSSSEDGRRAPRQYYEQPPQAPPRSGSTMGGSGYQPPPLTPQQYGGSSYGGASGLQPPLATMPHRVLSPPLAPSPQFHTPSQGYAFSPQQPPPSHAAAAAAFARSGAPSPGPPPGQQFAMAYPPGMQMQMAMRPPSSQAPTLGTPRLPTAVAAAAAAPAGLDAALDRIQTSLTALHERLAELERTNLSSSSTPLSTDLESPVSLLRLTFLRLLVLLRIRPAQRSTPRISWYSLFVRLVQSLIRVGRRVMGDLGIAVVMVALLGRVTGRGFIAADGVGEVVVRIVRALGGVRKAQRNRLVES